MPPFELGTGWRPEARFPRNRTSGTETVEEMLDKVGVTPFLKHPRSLPSRVDLSRWCSPVVFQGGYNDCAANVVAELVEYYERKTARRNARISRLFLFKTAKNLVQVTGNTGVYIRNVMGALTLFGAPPDKYWPYLEGGNLAKPTATDPRLDAEPTAFCYALADDYRSVQYYRFDGRKGETGRELLLLARAHLATQVPFAFGIPLFESIHQSMKTGKIPCPVRGEKQLGNHALLAIGYDDTMRIRNEKPGAKETVGAIYVQNSWSKKWGQKGFGWVPYEFILRDRARDFWTLTRAEWTDTRVFEVGE
jgi:C1A family cysteine protease